MVHNLVPHFLPSIPLAFWMNKGMFSGKKTMFKRKGGKCSKHFKRSVRILKLELTI